MCFWHHIIKVHILLYWAENRINSNFKKKKRVARVADTWQVCYIITLPSGQNTVTPVNNILCFTQYLNRLCSSAPKPVTCLTSQKQENQMDKVQIRALSPSPPRASDCLWPDIYHSSSGDGRAYEIKENLNCNLKYQLNFSDFSYQLESSKKIHLFFIWLKNAWRSHKGLLTDKLNPLQLVTCKSSVAV